MLGERHCDGDAARRPDQRQHTAPVERPEQGHSDQQHESAGKWRGQRRPDRAHPRRLRPPLPDTEQRKRPEGHPEGEGHPPDDEVRHRRYGEPDQRQVVAGRGGPSAQQPRHDHRGRDACEAAENLDPEQRPERREEHAVTGYGVPAVPLVVPQHGSTVLEQPHAIFLRGGVRAGEPERHRQPAQHGSDQPWAAADHGDAHDNGPNRRVPVPWTDCWKGAHRRWPGCTQHGFVQPGFVQPGFVQPGFVQPGFVQPGAEQTHPTPPCARHPRTR